MSSCEFFKIIQKPAPIPRVPDEPVLVDTLRVEPIDTPVKVIVYPIDTVPAYLTKDLYKVHLKLSINASDYDGKSLDASADTMLSFFQGCQIALDSLQSLGSAIEMVVTERPSSTKTPIINEPDSDLKINYQNGNVDVSVSGQNSESSYILNPGMAAHIKSAAAFIEKDFLNSKVTVIYRESSGFEKQVSELFCSEFFEEENDSTRLAANSVAIGDKGIDTLELVKNLDTGVVNIIYAPLLDEGTLSTVMRDLRYKCNEFSIVLFGLPNWRNFNSIYPEYLNKYQVMVTSGFYLDYENPFTIKMFRALYLEKYNYEPDPNAYLGFDVMYYFGALLQQFGNSANTVVEHEEREMMHNLLHFIPDSTVNNEYKNCGVNVLQFKEFVFNKIYR